MTTIEETIQKLYTNRQQFAVWENVISYLENSFVDQDANRAPKTILLDDGRSVSQEVIREMVTEISDKIMGPLVVEEAALLNVKVDKPKEKKKPAAKKKPVKPAKNGNNSGG